MSFIAQAPTQFLDQSVGSGECVAYVQTAARAPLTSAWRRGELVKDSQTPSGTAIATFDPDGRYGNHSDGRSHAAIFHSQVPEGLLVWDQWHGHRVSPRVIRFKDGSGPPCDDGDKFFVIETT